jgi:hypothetical protein
MFDRMVVKDAQLWNTMIAVYMAVGEADEVAEVADCCVYTAMISGCICKDCQFGWCQGCVCV